MANESICDIGNKFIDENQIRTHDGKIIITAELARRLVLLVRNETIEFMLKLERLHKPSQRVDRLLSSVQDTQEKFQFTKSVIDYNEPMPEVSNNTIFGSKLTHPSENKQEIIDKPFPLIVKKSVSTLREEEAISKIENITAVVKREKVGKIDSVGGYIPVMNEVREYVKTLPIDSSVTMAGVAEHFKASRLGRARIAAFLPQFPQLTRIAVGIYKRI